MKKLTRVLLLVAFVAFPIVANAGIIGNVTLQEYSSSPTGYVTFPSPTGGGNYYLDYDVKLNYGPLIEAFCVENANAPGNGVATPYTLLSIDSGLSAFGLDPSKYLAAAWVAEYYNTHAQTEVAKAAAQIAVWEIVFDGTGSFNLGSGNFKSSVYLSDALAIWNSRPATFPTSSTWALAVSPTVAVGGSVSVANYQNYLVRVPEPTTLLLLGLGLLGVAGVRRKSRR